MYGSEYWVVKAYQYHIHQLEVFHHRCFRCILGVTHRQQRIEYLTNKTLLNKFGMSDRLSCLLMERCMRLLGHVCRMDNDQQPKRLLFGELITFSWYKVVLERCYKAALERCSKCWFEITQSNTEWLVWFGSSCIPEALHIVSILVYNAFLEILAVDVVVLSSSRKFNPSFQHFL